jgi:hypothetical protein
MGRESRTLAERREKKNRQQRGMKEKTKKYKG